MTQTKTTMIRTDKQCIYLQKTRHNAKLCIFSNHALLQLKAIHSNICDY